MGDPTGWTRQLGHFPALPLPFMSGMVNFYRVATVRSDLDKFFSERITTSIILVGNIARSSLHEMLQSVKVIRTPPSHGYGVKNVMRPDEVVMFNNPAASSLVFSPATTQRHITCAFMSPVDWTFATKILILDLEGENVQMEISWTCGHPAGTGEPRSVTRVAL